jgi:hypothetical protein
LKAINYNYFAVVKVIDATVSILPSFIASMVAVWSDTSSGQPCGVQVEKCSPWPGSLSLSERVEQLDVRRQLIGRVQV